MTESVGGDKVVRLDHEGEKTDEGEAHQQDGGEDGDRSLHQCAVAGFTGSNSNRSKDSCYECQYSLARFLQAAAGPEDNGGGKTDGDDGKVAQKSCSEGQSR